MDSDSNGYSYFARMHKPYSDLSGVLTVWADNCKKFLVYEHPQEDGSERTHCHLIVVESTITDEAFKQRCKSKGLNLKGNKEWSFKALDMTKNPLVYCSKGKYDPKLNKGFEPQYVADERDKYVPPKDKSDEKRATQPNTLLDEFLEKLLKKYDSDVSLVEWTIVDVMRWSTGIYFSKKGCFPKPGSFKPTIASLYVHLKERQIKDGYVTSTVIDGVSSASNDFFGIALDYLGYFPKN